KLSEIPAAAAAAPGAHGIAAVTRHPIAARRHTRLLAATPSMPAFIQRKESAPPATPPSAPNSGGSQANQAARTKLKWLTSTRCRVVQLVHNEYGTMLNAFAKANPQSRRSCSIPIEPDRFASGFTQASPSLTARQSGIHRNPSPAVAINAVRQLYCTASHVAMGGARINPKLTPAWFRLLPSARSGGRQYRWIAFPAAGMPP